MIYENHNLFDNIRNIKGTKDMTISRELIVSEIAKIIVARPHEVRRALLDCGVAISDRPTKRDLVMKVSYNAAKSDCLRYNLGVLIMKNQMPFMNPENEREKYVNAEGNTQTSGGTDWGGVIGNVIGTSFGIWQTDQQRKEGQSQRAHEMALANKNAELMLKQMELQTELSKAPAPTQAGIGGGSNLVTILLVIAAVGMVGFAIYASRKSKGVATASAPTTTAV